MKLKEILEQFNVNIRLTAALENLDFSDGFKTYHTEKTDKGETIHIFTKELQVNEEIGKQELIVNPKKMEVLNILDYPENIECTFEIFDRKGQSVKKTLNKD